jgi:CRISPR/Cas system-associated exonuclease Cas4 (RecB family)
LLIEHLRPVPTVWTHDRGNTVGASEIGSCARMVWYRKRGQPEELEQGWGFAERGHVVEAWAFDAWRRAKIRLTHRQHTLTSGFLSATLDGFWNGYCVDVKSFDPRTIAPVKPKHILQVKVQIGLWKLSKSTPAKGGLLVYINASDFADVREVKVEPDPGTFQAMRLRARDIITSDTPPEREGAWTGECKFCPYQTACLGAPIKGEGTLPEEGQRKLADIRGAVAVEEYTIAASQKNIAKLRERAMETLRQHDVRRVPGVVSVTKDNRLTWGPK